MITIISFFVFTLILIIIYWVKYVVSPKTIYPKENKGTGDHFTIMHSDVIISNPDVCTPAQPKLCSVTNALSCEGCKSLTAICTHLDEDYPYKDENGVEGILTANSSADEGYCLNIIPIATRCNQFHGHLALISTTDGASSMLLCICSNPGVMGNKRLDGSCDVPMSCPLGVVDKNKALQDLECVCSGTQVNQKSINGPSCIDKTIFDAPDFGDTPQISYDHFNATIAGNFKHDMVNPCKVCPVSHTIIPNSEIIASDDGFECVVSDNKGIPIRLNDQERILKGTIGPDAVLALEWKMIKRYPRTSPDYNNAVFVIEYTAFNKWFYENLNLDVAKNYAILASRDLLIPGHAGYNLNLNGTSPNARCWTTSLTTYNCGVDPGGTKDIAWALTKTLEGAIQKSNENANDPFPHWRIVPKGTIRVNNNFPYPWSIFGDSDTWNKTIYDMNPVVAPVSIRGLANWKLNNRFFGNVDYGWKAKVFWFNILANIGTNSMGGNYGGAIQLVVNRGDLDAYWELQSKIMSDDIPMDHTNP